MRGLGRGTDGATQPGRCKARPRARQGLQNHTSEPTRAFDGRPLPCLPPARGGAAYRSRRRPLSEPPHGQTGAAPPWPERRRCARQRPGPLCSALQGGSLGGGARERGSAGRQGRAAIPGFPFSLPYGPVGGPRVPYRQVIEGAGRGAGIWPHNERSCLGSGRRPDAATTGAEAEGSSGSSSGRRARAPLCCPAVADEVRREGGS